MKIQLLTLWEKLHTSFWFMPAVMTVTAIALAVVMVAVDEIVKERVLEKFGWVWMGGPEGARQMLSTIAGSMIGIAGVTFSITIVALALASAQFGPRLLRNFMRDTGNQIVLGTFIATFMYCLLVLRTVRGGNGSEFVPHLSVTLGMVLALASLGVLIYFIHHVSVSIQAPHVIALVARDLDDALERLFPERLGCSPSDEPLIMEGLPTEAVGRGSPVAATGSGYLQTVDIEQLTALATSHNLLLHLHYRPGDFITQGAPFVTVWPRERVTAEVAEELDATCVRGEQRIPTQDVQFAIDELVEVAVRALSPGVNDPFTAMTCIDWLGAGLCRLSTRAFPSPNHYDDRGKLRVIGRPLTFPDLVDAAFNQIRQYGRADAGVTLRLLEAITIVTHCVSEKEKWEALLHQAEMIVRGSHEGLPEERDRQRVAHQFQAVRSAAKRRSSAPEQPEHEVNGKQ